jgi:hypothetical protein
MKRPSFILLVLALTLLLASCRNETQNIIRRNIQDFTSDRMYITLYTLDGTPVFEGVVDGKVTRASSTGETSEPNSATGDYIFWFDDRGRYHQSDLPYLVTSYDRNAATE